MYKQNENELSGKSISKNSKKWENENYVKQKRADGMISVQVLKELNHKCPGPYKGWSGAVHNQEWMSLKYLNWQ